VFNNPGQFLAPDLPIYTLKNKKTGAKLRSNDPGRAMITGKWSDIGRFKSPVLRGLAAHAPYFHNGMAPTLLDVVNFYDKGKAIPSGLGFTDQEKSDLVAFLSAL
jgi:cytochrome c peroxidase